MKRRFTRFLGLSAVGLTLLAGPARSQDKDNGDKARGEMPRTETAPAPAAVPAAPTMPATDAFLPAATQQPGYIVGVEFLQWWYKKDAIPSLLNTAKETDTFFAGTQNDPKAANLFGPSQYAYHTVPGIRLNLAAAVVENVDVEFSGFLMESKSISSTFAGTNGQPFLTRPFFNQHDLSESGYDTSSMSGISGSLNVQTHNQLYGTEANISWFPMIEKSSFYKLSFGVRQISLSENLTVTENVGSNQDTLTGSGKSGFLAFFPTRTSSGPTDTVGTLVSTNFNPVTQSIRIVDGFVTRNEFYGPQASAQWRWNRGPFALDLLTKIAVGVDHETIHVQGATSLLTGGVVTQTGPGGLLAVSKNSGFQSHEELAVVPELGLKFNFNLSDSIAFNAGYNMLYMSSVARPGSQIDRRINPQFVPSDVAYFPSTPGPNFPRGFFRDTDFYAHGISFGLVFSY